MYRLRLNTDAEVDFAEAVDYYDQQQSGVAIEFIETVEGYFESIRSNPLQFGLVAGNFRRAIVRRFHHQIIFRVDPDEIVVFVIVHTSRDEQSWLKRLKN